MIHSTSPLTQRRIHKLLIAVVVGAALGGVAGWKYSTQGWDPESEDVLALYSKARILTFAGLSQGGIATIAGHEVDSQALLARLRCSRQERLFARAFEQTFYYGPAAGAAALALVLIGGTVLMEKKS